MINCFSKAQHLTSAPHKDISEKPDTKMVQKRSSVQIEHRNIYSIFLSTQKAYKKQLQSHFSLWIWSKNIADLLYIHILNNLMQSWPGKILNDRSAFLVTAQKKVLPCLQNTRHFSFLISCVQWCRRNRRCGEGKERFQYSYHSFILQVHYAKSTQPGLRHWTSFTTPTTNFLQLYSLSVLCPL